MTNRENVTGESGYSKYSKLFARAVMLIAICGLILGAEVLASARAASDISTTEAYTDPTADFPDQFVKQPEQIMMMMYFLDD